MKRSIRMASDAVSLLVALATPALGLEDPAKKVEPVKPPWQRLLQGEDDKRAAEQEKKLKQLLEVGQFVEGLKVAEALAELRAKAQGTDHWQAVDARFQVDAVRRVLSVNMKEQQSYGRAFGLKREADALLAKGRYREAQPLLEQVLAIRRKVLGEEHPSTADSYDELASSLYDQGRYVEAEEISRKVLAIRCKALGEAHPDTAASHNNLANNLGNLGRHTEEVEDSRKALAIWRKILGEEHTLTAQGYNNLAVILDNQARYQEAASLHQKALAIRRKLLGEEHLDTAQSYNSEARNLYFQGKYFEAQENFRKALAIRRKLLGEEHPSTASSYNNLAVNHHAQGNYAEAAECLRRALVIERKVLGEEHPQTAAFYNGLARILLIQGKYAEEEEDFRKALAIRRKVLGQEHLATAESYNNIAKNLDAQGKYAEAEEDLSRALAIKRKLLGEEHSYTALGYDNLAVNLRAQGKYAEAEEAFRKALAIRRKILGEEHSDTAKSYNEAAKNLYAQGRYAEAEKFWRSAAVAFDKARLHLAATGLERATKTSERSPLPALAAVLARNGKPRNAWQRVEQSLARGTWDDLSARLRRPQAERDQQTRIAARIGRLNKLIEKASVSKPTLEQSKQRDELLSQLRQAYDELAAFTQQLETKYGPVAGKAFPRAQIQASLDSETALLAWLDIDGQPKAADPNGEHWAILLRSSGDPIWVRLTGSGEKNAWTDADTRLPAELRAALQSPKVNWQPLVQRLRKQRLDPLAQHLNGVRRLIVLPSTALAGVPIEVIADGYTVSYAHSGTMYAHLLRQVAPSGKGLFVLADPIFDTPTQKEKPQPLPPGGVLVTMVLPGSNAAGAKLQPNDVLLRYDDMDLNSPADFKPRPESGDPKQIVSVTVWREGKTLTRQVRPGKLGVVFAQDPAPQAVVEQRRLDRLLASRGGEDGNWSRLPGTRVEAASLQRLFGSDSAQVLLDSEASEQRLNELAQRGDLGKYRYIHLATHGEVNDVFPLRSAVILSCDHLPDDKQRSELLVSGQPIPDGRLEAQEALARWNLHCDLVTLSACETALGKYERGEGFVGFTQSLILCGTRSVCLSLWKVDDVATALLMERFYQNLLGKREELKAPLPKAEALAEAKAWLRGLPREEAVKRAASLSNGVDRGKRPALPPLEVAPASVPVATEKSDRPFTHPYYWAAFVLVGHAD